MLLLPLLLLAAPTAPTLSVAPLDFLGAPSITPLHHGMNFEIIGTARCWAAESTCDASAASYKRGFYDHDGDASVRAAFAALPMETVRIAGGFDSNSYDFTGNQGWINWVHGDTGTFNVDGIAWDRFFSFYAATGSPELMTTANVFRRGSPSSSWVNLNNLGVSAPRAWAKFYKDDHALPGTFFEMGNELYGIGDFALDDGSSISSINGLTYMGTGDHSYPRRACKGRTRVLEGDSTARVGLVVTSDEQWSTWDDFLDLIELECDDDDFDFFIYHSYLPIHPSYSGSGDTNPDFWQDGMERSVAFMNETDDIASLRATLDARGLGSKEIHVTEWGLLTKLHAFNNADPRWDEKGAGVLAVAHYFDQIASGADGLWFWTGIDTYPAPVDAATGNTTRLYELLQKSFALEGQVILDFVSASPKFDVDGKVGSGCLEGFDGDACWREVYTPPPTGEEKEWPTLTAWSVFDGERQELHVVVLNIAATSSNFIANLNSFTMDSAVTVTRWRATASTSWDANLAAPTTSTITAVYNHAAPPTWSLPARSLTIYTFDLGS